jgi:hypothetical protein
MSDTTTEATQNQDLIAQFDETSWAPALHHMKLLLDAAVPGEWLVVQIKSKYNEPRIYLHCTVEDQDKQAVIQAAAQLAEEAILSTIYFDALYPEASEEPEESEDE